MTLNTWLLRVFSCVLERRILKTNAILHSVDPARVTALEALPRNAAVWPRKSSMRKMHANARACYMLSSCMQVSISNRSIRKYI